MPEDPDVERLWIIAKVAETFHVLPSVAAKSLDEDPERIDLTCASLLGYASVKRSYDNAKGDDKKLEHLDEKAVASVRMNQFLGAKQRRTHNREHKTEKDLGGCRFCRGERDGR